MTVTGTEQRVYGKLMSDCYIDLHRFAIGELVLVKSVCNDILTFNAPISVKLGDVIIIEDQFTPANNFSGVVIEILDSYSIKCNNIIGYDYTYKADPQNVIYDNYSDNTSNSSIIIYNKLNIGKIQVNNSYISFDYTAIIYEKNYITGEYNLIDISKIDERFNAFHVTYSYTSDVSGTNGITVDYQHDANNSYIGNVTGAIITTVGPYGSGFYGNIFVTADLYLKDLPITSDQFKIELTISNVCGYDCHDNNLGTNYKGFPLTEPRYYQLKTFNDMSSFYGDDTNHAIINNCSKKYEGYITILFITDKSPNTIPFAAMELKYCESGDIEIWAYYLSTVNFKYSFWFKLNDEWKLIGDVAAGATSAYFNVTYSNFEESALEENSVYIERCEECQDSYLCRTCTTPTLTLIHDSITETPNAVVPYGYTGNGMETAFFNSGSFIEYAYDCDQIDFWTGDFASHPTENKLYYKTPENVTHLLDTRSPPMSEIVNTVSYDFNYLKTCVPLTLSTVCCDYVTFTNNLNNINNQCNLANRYLNVVYSNSITSKSKILRVVNTHTLQIDKSYITNSPPLRIIKDITGYNEVTQTNWTGNVNYDYGLILHPGVYSFNNSFYFKGYLKLYHTYVGYFFGGSKLPYEPYPERYMIKTVSEPSKTSMSIGYQFRTLDGYYKIYGAPYTQSTVNPMILDTYYNPFSSYGVELYLYLEITLGASYSPTDPVIWYYGLPYNAAYYLTLEFNIDDFYMANCRNEKISDGEYCLFSRYISSMYIE